MLLGSARFGVRLAHFWPAVAAHANREFQARAGAAADAAVESAAEVDSKWNQALHGAVEAMAERVPFLLNRNAPNLEEERLRWEGRVRADERAKLDAATIEKPTDFSDHLGWQDTDDQDEPDEAPVPDDGNALLENLWADEDEETEYEYGFGDVDEAEGADEAA